MTESDFHKISLKDLEIGSPILWNVYDANGRLLARVGFIPQSEKQLETLIERGLFVNEAEYRQSSAQGASARGHATKNTSTAVGHQVLSKLGNALTIIQNVNLGVVANAPLPQVPEMVMQVVRVLNESVSTNPDIAIANIHFKQTPEGYANRHLIDTAVLSLIVAKAMQMSETEVEAITAAALTMNIGMLFLQEDLQNRATPPTEEERALIRKHPQLSVALLKEAGVTNLAWLSYVLNHHEQLDGSGYPAGISGNSIPLGAKIIALADRYTAMIAPRKVRKGIHPAQALGSLLVDNDKIFDAKITTFFIQELGMYPPGCCVKLASGETAVVMAKGGSTTTPDVMVIKNANGDVLPSPELRKTEAEAFAIKEGVALEVNDIPFTAEQIWGAQAA